MQSEFHLPISIISRGLAYLAMLFNGQVTHTANSMHHLKNKEHGQVKQRLVILSPVKKDI